MSRPCTVCARLDRAEIDKLLARHIVNVREVARVYKLGRDAVANHRAHHLPDFVPAFTADADAPTMSKLHAEYQRLYLTALDELARAQAGTLIGIDEQGKEQRTVSSTAIGRALDNVRKSLGSLVNLAADAAPPESKPSGVASGELMARIRAQVERIEARPAPQLDAPDCIVMQPEVHDDAVPEGALAPSQPADRQQPPGGQGGGAGGLAPPTIPLDAEISPENLPGITPHIRQLLQQDQAAKQATDIRTAHEDQVVAYVPNPSFPGSPAASAEERQAMGYPDIPVTLGDLRAASSPNPGNDPTYGASPARSGSAHSHPRGTAAPTTSSQLRR